MPTSHLSGLGYSFLGNESICYVVKEGKRLFHSPRICLQSKYDVTLLPFFISKAFLKRRAMERCFEMSKVGRVAL